MRENLNSIKSNDNSGNFVEKDAIQKSNPIQQNKIGSDLMLTNYSQTFSRHQHDEEFSSILEVVRILNNMAPVQMPEYNFNIDEINGERYYRPDGSLLLVREYDGDIIRDYYSLAKNEVSKFTVSRILEHDKNTGRLKTKIEPILRNGSKLKTNITIFDLKINNKYIIIQLSEDGYVNNISEFAGKGKSFQTLYRNINTLKPARYIEGKDSAEKGFTMIDCIFDNDGNIVRIKHYYNKKEINIDYTKTSKNVSVKKSL